VKLAEVDSEAINLSRCQGVGELVHRSLRERRTQHKAFFREKLAFAIP
jgi:hypothetical protein